jgi:hypothetical protein
MMKWIAASFIVLTLAAGCESTGVLGGNSFTLHVEGENNTLTIGGAATQSDGGSFENPTAAEATSETSSPQTPVAPSGGPDSGSAGSPGSS